MYVAVMTHVAVSLVWLDLGDEEQGESMRFDTTAPTGDSTGGIYMHERFRVR